jgi:hypothetical protein
MRILIRIPLLVMIAAGGVYADEPPAASPPAATAPATAPTPAKPSGTPPTAAPSEATARPTDATAPAPGESKSATPTAEQVDRYLRAKGYTPRMINGKKYYCRGEDLLGTRLQHAQQCAPADQLNVQERTSQEGVTRMQRSNFGSPSNGGKP